MASEDKPVEPKVQSEEKPVEQKIEAEVDVPKKDEEVKEQKKDAEAATPKEEVKTEEVKEQKEDKETTSPKKEVKSEEMEVTKESEEKEVSKKDEKMEVSKDEEATPQKEEVKTEVEEVKKEQNGKTQEPSDLEKKVIKQIEYYFGDLNLGKDKFLQGQIKQDNGWVHITVLLTFNRLKSITEDAKAIAEAMRKSSSGIIEVSEDDTKIRRNPEKPLPVFDKDRKEDLKSRTLYVKGFPTEMNIDSLEEFFVPFGKIEHILLRRDNERNFKGSVFVIFTSVAEAKKFLETESIKCKDTDLKRMFKEDYFKMKGEEKIKLKETELKDKEKQESADDDKNSLADRITKGTVIHMDGLPDGLSVEELREKFSVFGDVAWVEFRRGDTNCRIRFANKDEGKTALEKAKEAGEGKVMLNETEVKAHVLEGEEELKFWKDLFSETKNRKAKQKRRGGGRGGGPPFKRRKH